MGLELLKTEYKFSIQAFQGLTQAPKIGRIALKVSSNFKDLQQLFPFRELSIAFL